MFKKVKQIFALCLSCILILSLFPISVFAAETGTLNGVLQQNNGTVSFVSGVEVELRTADSNYSVVATSVTDADGKYEFTNIEQGAYLIAINSDVYFVDDNDYLSSSYGAGYITAVVGGSATSFKNIVVVRVNGVVKMTKTDPDGNAVVDAVYEVYKNNDLTPIATLTTDANGEISISGLGLGDYTIKEKTAPAGFVINETPVTFSITKENQIFTNLTHIDIKCFDVTIFKKIEGTDKNLPGATLVIKQNGNEIERFTSSNEPKKILLAPGDYVLCEEVTPAGYLPASDVSFTVSSNNENEVTMYDTPVRVKITKLGETKTGEFINLSDAKLRLVSVSNPDVKYEWVTDNEPYIISGVPVGDYVLSEIITPDGYVTCENVPVTVELTSKLQEFELTNKLKRYNLIISKIDAVSKEALPGAKLQLFDSNDNMIKEWTSDTDDFVIEDLLSGEYKIIEKKAPNGYLTIQPIDVSVSGDDDNVHVIVANDYTKLLIEKRDAITNEMLSGAKLHIEDSSGNIIKSWISGDEAFSISHLMPGKYILIEDEAPEGYDIASPIEFEIENTNIVQTVTIINHATKIPVTGDSSNILFYFILMALSIISIAVTTVKIKKHNM